MVQQKASVAPRTVTEISQGKHKPRQTRRASMAGHPASGRITHIRTDIRVWKVAMKLAKGDRHRLEVRQPDVVVVHNNNTWKG